jgi:hypothetical protein
MAKYKDIGGTTVEFKSGTEEYAYGTSGSGSEGSIYYNSSNGNFEFVGLGTGAWSTGGTMNNDERYISAAAGTNTAAVAFGGQAPVIGKTETYNGTAWTEVNALNTARSYLGGAGTQPAALAICGGPSPPYNNVESWDGTNWTEVSEVNAGGNAYGSGSCGTQTAALITMRISGPEAYTEKWDGSSWTEVGDMNNSREGGAVCGTSTSAIAGGGATVTHSESWNGSAWTEVSELNTARQTLGGSGSSNTDGLIFGGNVPGAQGGATTAPNTESWNGTSWTEVADLASAQYGGGAGKSGSSSTSTFVSGGSSPSAPTGNTEEWSFSHAIKTVTTS